MTKKTHLIIIGGIAAGVKAAARARRVNSELDITLFEAGPEVSYSACGEPYYISGIIPDRESLIMRRPDEFAKDNIHIKICHKVINIDIRAQSITAIDLNTGISIQQPYDQLIIATGAQAIIPPIPGRELDGVISLRTLTDSDRLKSLLSDNENNQVVIVGTGYIGLEIAESLIELDTEVHLVDQCERVFPRMDAHLSDQIHNKLVEKGVNVLLNDSVTSIQGQNQKVESIITQSGLTLSCNVVILACGVKPNIELAEQSGIKLGSTGAIEVDQRMQTNIENIFAAGDCVQSQHRISGLPAWLPLGDIANLQGRVAGENASGGDARFPGVIGTSIFRSFDMEIGMTGLSEDDLNKLEIDYCETLIESRDRARYYPGGQTLSLKLLAQKSNGKLLGAQAVGTGGVAKMIDISATALLGNLSCFDLEYADLAYAPPFSPVLSPMIIAASQLCKMVSN